MPKASTESGLPDPAPLPPFGYLDAVGGQPVLPAAVPAWRAASQAAWADPARLHHLGRRAGMMLDAARASIATSLGLRPDEVFLTSSGPTAVGVAVQGMLEGRERVSERIVLSAVESMAVLSPARRWAGEVDAIPVHSDGHVDVTAFAAALDRPAALACVQAANAEVGTRQPLATVHERARAAGVPLLVHAVQVIGHDPVPVHWDLLAASARDWGGPAGIGILAVRPSARWIPEQTPDRGWVGGFPDIAAAVAAATALEYLRSAGTAAAERHRAQTERMRAELPNLVTGLFVAGDPVDRLPHIVTFTCEALVGEALVGELDRRGISVASGSACTSDSRMPSHVLAEMGLAGAASVRVSLPYGCTDETVDAFLRELPEAVAVVRGQVAT